MKFTSEYKTPELYASPESTQIAFELTVRLEKKLRRILHRVAKQWGADISIADDLWGEVVLDRGPRIIELWRPGATANIENYYLRSVRQYAEKRMQRRANRDPKQAPRYESGSQEPVEIAEIRAEVELLLDQLHPFDAWVLKAHIIEGYSYAEIAEALDRSKSYARVAVRRALRRAREVVEEQEPDVSDMDFVEEVG